MPNKPLYTMVAGGVLELDAEFNVKCNCGGDAPIRPTKIHGYGYSKKGGAMKVVDKLETKCRKCNTTINVLVVEGDPGYVLTSNGGMESLFLPQGSTSLPVAQLSQQERMDIVKTMKEELKEQMKKQNKKPPKKKRKKK